MKCSSFSVLVILFAAVCCENLDLSRHQDEHQMHHFQDSLFSIFERLGKTLNRNQTITEDKSGNLYMLNIVKNLSLNAPSSSNSSGNVADNSVIRVIESCNTATTSGLYKLKAVNRAVHCEMTSFGGRWLVIQHRKKFDVDFNRNWQAYRNGFGSVGMDDDFWLGLEAVHQITNDGHSYELMMELKHELQYGYARYSSFRIAGEADHYRVSVSGFSGSIPDRFTHHNNMKFSTYDKDNDNWTGNCALAWKSGWWFNRCHESNLNKQIGTPTVVIFWNYWGHYLTYTRMMVRRK